MPKRCAPAASPPPTSSIGYALRLADNIGLSKDFGPNVAAYWARLQQRDGYKRAVAAERKAGVEQNVAPRGSRVTWHRHSGSVRRTNPESLEIPGCRNCTIEACDARSGMTAFVTVTAPEFPLWLPPSQRPKSRARRNRHGRQRPQIRPSDADHAGAGVLRRPARPPARALPGRASRLCRDQGRAVAHDRRRPRKLSAKWWRRRRMSGTPSPATIARRFAS